MIKVGDTHVLCTATIEERVPPFREGHGLGWVTAEYGMLPRSTGSRMRREATVGKQGGRTVEIQRLIGRSLARGRRPRRAWRAADHRGLRRDPGRWRHALRVDHRRLGGAAAGGGKLMKAGDVTSDPLIDPVAAVSCGIYAGQPVLDLDYPEDSEAGVDGNFIMTGSGA